MFSDFFETGLIGALTLVADENGLRQIIFGKQANDNWTHRPEFFAEVKRQLRAYFDGKLKTFDLPLAPEGTAFQRSVWNALSKIPYSDTVSYKSIAKTIGNPKAVRAVGAANGKNPIPIIVPCHRVIGADGSLTGFGGGLKAKSALIELEKSYRE